MDITGTSFNPLFAPSTSFYTDAEKAQMAQAAEQQALTDKGVMGRGLERGLHQTAGSLSNALGQIVEPFSTDAAEPMFDWAKEREESAKKVFTPEDVQSYDKVNGLGSGLRYVGAKVSENIPNMAVSLPLGVAARLGLRNAAMAPLAKNVLATSAGAFPLQLGEGVQTVREADAANPTESLTPLQKLGYAAGYGALTAPMEAADEALLMGRAMGTGKVLKNVFKDGLMPGVKAATAHVAKAIPEAALTEGLPEVMQQKTQQLLGSHINPDRDTSKDTHDLAESFFGGWAAGAPSSMVGRTSDVAWSNARGAREAIGKLLEPKALPAGLHTADDATINQWDQQDNAQRNSWAKDVADKVLNSDAADRLKQGATNFYERATQGAQDAWTSMSDALNEHETYRKGADEVDHFINAAKKTYKDISGGDAKANVEASPEDQVMYDGFRGSFSPKSHAAADTQKASLLYDYTKRALSDGNLDLPWDSLSHAFGSMDNMRAAVSKLREQLVRTGKVEHDPNFFTLFDAAVNDGAAGQQARSEVVKRYLDLKHGDVSQDDARQLSRMVSDGLQAYPEWGAKRRQEFDTRMKDAFGKNVDKVVEVHAPRKAEHESVYEPSSMDSEGVVHKTGDEVATKPRFVGQAVDRARKNYDAKGDGIEDSVHAHGGMWNLGHGNEAKRKSIRTKLAEQVKAERALGNDTRLLTPLEYANESGLGAGKVASALGTSVEKLADHPARMLVSTPKEQIGLSKDTSKISTDDINAWGKNTAANHGLWKSKVLDADTATKVSAALKQSGRAQREAMKSLGLQHGVKLEQTPKGMKLINNLEHDANGVMRVIMKDGSEHLVTAQQLIKNARERGVQGSVLKSFSDGVAAVMAHPDVADIKVQNVWGKEKTRANTKASSMGRFGPHFRLTDDITLGHAVRSESRGKSLKDAVDLANERVDALEEKLAELEANDAPAHEIEAVERELEDAHEAAVAEAKAQDDREGEGERPGAVGAAAEDKPLHRTVDQSSDKPRTFDEEGNPLHPHETKQPAATEVRNINGMELKVAPGVRYEHFNAAARQVIAGVREAGAFFDKGGLPLKTLHIAADYAARSADAQLHGDQKARDALALTAQHRLHAALVDEMVRVRELADKATDAEKPALREKYAALRAEAVKFQKGSDEYLAGGDALRELAENYQSFAPKKVAEEAPAGGEALKPAEQRMRELAKAEHAAKSEAAASEEARREADREAVDKAAAEWKAEQEAKREQEFRSLEGSLDRLGKHARSAGENLKATARTLIDALRNGELNKPELVASVRAALRDLRAVAADAAVAVQAAVQKIIKAYQEAQMPAVTGKANAEGSFASGKALTEADLTEARAYVEKTLGSQVKVLLAQELGGNSAAWNRVDGEAIIRIAAHATNPLSKAHHEAMHEFFQRLSETHPEAAEILSKAAGSASVVRQIEQFFHNDANYAKIKAALAADQHERVAYMFQLWAAGKLNVGTRTEGVFAKVANFLRKAFGMISDGQHAEAIMQQFHDGKMSEPGDVARVLAQDTKARAALFASAGKYGKPAYESARELLITAQNELIDSGNKGLEKIGRLFSNETGAKDKDISFMSARVQKANQMNDRFFDIIKGLDQKDMDAVRDGLQSGSLSKDEKIREAQERIQKMLSGAGGIHDYLREAGVDIPKRQKYFPRAWDHLAISENKQEFIDLLVKHGGLDKDAAAETFRTLVENRGAEPLMEGESRIVGFTPFMASANKRQLDFANHADFLKFQQKDLAHIISTYVSHAVHRGEYSRRFGNDGQDLRTMVKDAIGEHVGEKEWAAATKAATEVFAKAKAAAEAKSDVPGEVRKELMSAGYLHGKELDIKHITEHLSGEALGKFNAFQPQLRRAQRAVMAMEGTLGADVDPTMRKWSSGLIVYENMRLLGMSLFSQVIDPLGVVVRGGTLPQAWDTFKRGIQGTIAGWKGTPIEDRMTKLARQLGVIDAGNFLNSQSTMYSSVYFGETAKKWNDRLFRWNGVEGYSQGTRVGAMAAAISFIKSHAEDKTRNEHSDRYLEELGLTKADVKLVDDELDFTDKKIQDAIFRWVDGAILRPNAAMRPSWASDPHYALLFHMKTFTYATQKVLLERVAKEVEHGNLDPALAMVFTYVPAMIVSDALRGMINNGGQEPPWKKKWSMSDYLWDGVQRAGLLGIPQLALDVKKWGPGELGGPVVEQALNTVKTYEKSFKKDRALDEKALRTHKAVDQEAADKYDGFIAGTKKNLRAAIPLTEPMKKMVYDPVAA